MDTTFYRPTGGHLHNYTRMSHTYSSESKEGKIYTGHSGELLLTVVVEKEVFDDILDAIR